MDAVQQRSTREQTPYTELSATCLKLILQRNKRPHDGWIIRMEAMQSQISATVEEYNKQGHVIK